MIAFDIIEVTLLGAALVIGGYLVALTVLASRAPTEHRFATRKQRQFAFVIPAHNEETGIGATVASVLSVEYPRPHFDVIVIADNCTDGTARLAREAGATVLERHDSSARGKGYALRWGFDLLTGGRTPYDAFVVIDADSVVTPNYLVVLNWYLEKGALAVQTSDLVAPGNEGWNAQMTRIGFLLYNYVRPLGRTALMGSAGLRGNGMCFATELLARVPWKAYSVAEDLEYGLQLLLEDIRVAFAREAGVFAVMPVDARNAVGQRARWEGGRLGLIRRYAPPLARRFFAAPSLAYLDASLDLLTPALVNLIGSCFLAALLTSVLLWFGIPRAGVYASLWLVVSAMGCGHLIAGLIIAQADRSVYRALAHIPRYAFWKIGVYMRMPGRWSKHVWTRTTREARRDILP